MAALLPPNLDFHRALIPAAPTPAPKRISPSLSRQSTISAAAAASAGIDTKQPDKKSFFGSVSTADIAGNIKAILAEDKEGKRVVFAPEDISFVVESEDKDRVKHFGVYEIDIKIKGAPDSIRRTIQIREQE